MSPQYPEEMIKKTLLQKRIDGKAQCLTCEKRCIIEDGGLGFCKTRKNIDGVIYTLVYGEIAPDFYGIQANPIEKKPFFHFYPGTKALTIGTWSCNFTCPWCQNYDMSKRPEKIGDGYFLSSEQFIEIAKKMGCQGTSISFNEPTLLFEYSLEIFKLAKEEGLYNTFVTNGYMTTDALKMLVESGLDGVNIDIKGNKIVVERFCGADIEKVWRNIKLAKEYRVWVELTTLIIPGVNDSKSCIEEIARRIKDEVGKETPWHITGYYPAFKFDKPPTRVEVLEKAWEIGKGLGLDYVYLGNFPGHPYENTYCPKCNEILIGRNGFSVTEYKLTEENCCPRCNYKIPVIH
uniref:AmmeMemoRadiSam system radical SAM enzyme n=1 Tax=candidate division WOR-3 bacterium TaxID=2052148 RepID=A0A7C4TA74_UNCW3